MDKILYFPYINLPKTEWTTRALLYYDNVGSIVPQEYFYEPERNYDPFMLELVQMELVVPINPIQVLENPWEVGKPFMDFVTSQEYSLDQKRINFRIGHLGKIHSDKFRPSSARIHADKFDGEIFYQLEQIGLAERADGSWYQVERMTADYLMKFLASIISGKLEMRPTTDNYKKRFSFSRVNEKHSKSKREKILKELIPFPEDIDLNKVLRFKSKHPDLIKSFRNKVEQLALDETLIEDSDLFKERLTELKIRKEELTAKMNEGQFKNIIFGTVCGVFGAAQGLVSAETPGAILGGLPGFASAIHSALKIEKAEDLFDQSGMKYMALIDKRLSKTSRQKRL